jgi:hypothetical protein
MIETLYLKNLLQIFWFLNDFKFSIDLVSVLLFPSSITKTVALFIKKIPGISPPANYTDRATAACRRS